MTARDKALRLLADGRVKMDRTATTPTRTVFAVIGDTDPFTPYTVTCEYDGNLLVESCTCEGGQFHPVRSKCSHSIAARIVCAVIQSPRR